MKARRYKRLADEIKRIGALRIVEIGTCKGTRAALMIEAALANGPVEYHGFDLFEVPPANELAGMTPPTSMQEVRDRLAPLGASVRLYKGNSLETLPAAGLQGIDFVFIDGGHSDETVKADFSNVQNIIRPGASIMLDDYWDYPEGGCNKLVDNLDRAHFSVEILEPVDVFPKPYGKLSTQIVRVIPR